MAEDHQGINWVCTCFLIGGLIGFLFGASSWSPFPAAWRQRLAVQVRASNSFKFLVFEGPFWDDTFRKVADWTLRVEREWERDHYLAQPAHPRVFAVLREAVVRENGGYVHPDLGMLHPAPSGSVRGLGMVRDGYYRCQSNCFPGTEQERRQQKKDAASTANSDETDSPSSSSSNNNTDDQHPTYKQEEILIRVPLKFQMTRTTALDLLMKLIPADVQRTASLHELDDAALLVLQLAHERGVGRYSRWLPYIASLPPEPSCGYSRHLRPYMLDALQAYKNEMGVDTEGWSDELVKAMHYGERIADGLNGDYGAYLQTPEGVTSLENIQWALCQVASRATAGSEKFGSLRLVPVVDLINHDISAGGFVELSGDERLDKGDLLDATSEVDAGAFVVRSLRHGRRKPLRQGQELLANYNVPHYSALDWFVSLGFVPPERWGPWVKIDPVLPQIRRDGPFREDSLQATDEMWNGEAKIMQHLKEADLL